VCVRNSDVILAQEKVVVAKHNNIVLGQNQDCVLVESTHINAILTK